MIPMDASREDSTARAEAIIDSWLREQAILHRAELNLPDAEKDFETKLRDYRNELIIYAYERTLVEQKLDTAITEDAIEAYYEANPNDLALKEHMVRARWFRIRDDDKRTLRKLAVWFQSDRPEDHHELEVWLATHGVTVHEPAGGDAAAGGWMTFRELQATVPIGPVEDPAGFLAAQPRHRLQVNDSAGTCFVDILEHRPQGSVSPLPLVRRRIHDVLLEQRKRELLRRMREDLYHEALEKNEIGAL